MIATIWWIYDIALYTLAVIGFVTVVRWRLERWRTRKDKGYDSSSYGAY